MLTDDQKMFWTLSEKEMAIADEKLKIIIKVVTEFTEATEIYLLEFQDILKEMAELKIEIAQEKRNFHYLDCVWSDVNCRSGPDTCKCCFRYWKPEYFIDLIVNLIGKEFILWKA